MPIQTYIEYLLPGILFSEEVSRKVEERSTEKALQNMPQGAFAYRYYDLLTELVTAFGEPRELHKRTNEGPLCYIGGSIFDAKGVAELSGDNRILLSNMHNNEYPFVIHTRAGNWQPFYPEKDVLVDANV